MRATNTSFFTQRGKQANQIEQLMGAMDQGARSNSRASHARSGDLATAGQQMASGNKNVSLLKAELVRNNLVTRSDLMKLYQPPVKKSALLENNPFFNRSIVSGEEYVDHQQRLPYSTASMFNSGGAASSEGQRVA